MDTAVVKMDAETGELVAQDVVNCHNGREETILNGKGVKNLVIATIQQAVDDYKALVKAGVIVGSKIVMATMPHKVCDGMTIPEAKDTIMFFEDRNIGNLLRLAGIDIEPRRFRAKLGMVA